VWVGHPPKSENVECITTSRPLLFRPIKEPFQHRGPSGAGCSTHGASAAPGKQPTLQADNSRLRAELADTRGQLADAERLATQQCKHPAAAVDGDTCHACDTDVR
jgi:hypothetical protein